MSLSSNNDPYGDTAADLPGAAALKGTDTRITDSILLPDNLWLTIEQGRAYAQGWRYSGFSGTGYLVRVNGIPVPNGQFATRREALELAQRINLERDPA